MLSYKSYAKSVSQVATGDGVILGVEKRITSTLLETSSVEKIVEIDRHIGCAMSGLQADARSLIEHARVESQNHAFHYNEPLRVESCTQAICDLALRFGEGADGEESIMSRPFGVALLLAGYDESGPSLYALHTLLCHGLDLPHQISRRTVRYLLQIRCKGNRVRVGGRSGGTTE